MIIIEFILYKKDKYQQSLVSFSAYSEKIDQVTSSHEMPQKSAQIFEQPSNNISPRVNKSQDGG